MGFAEADFRRIISTIWRLRCGGRVLDRVTSYAAMRKFRRATATA